MENNILVGCNLFRLFLEREHSVENLDFWFECEEFKKLKEGKKATQQRAHAVYNKFVKDKAEKEVSIFFEINNKGIRKIKEIPCY